MKILVSTALAYLSTISPVIAQDYICERNIFGCYTRYVGAVDEPAAEGYLADAKRVSVTIVDSYPEIQAVFYELSTGELVIQASGTRRVSDLALRDIGDLLNDNRLYVTNLRVLDSSLRWELNSARVQRLNGGKSRFFALNELLVPRN